MPGFSISPEERRAFDEEGYFVTAPAFSEAELAPVRAAIVEAWTRRQTERTRSEEARLSSFSRLFEHKKARLSPGF